MRGHVGGHADRDTRGSVDQQVRYARREHRRFVERIVEVGNEVHGFFVEVAQKFLTHTGELYLRITHGGGRVSVD